MFDPSFGRMVEVYTFTNFFTYFTKDYPTNDFVVEIRKHENFFVNFQFYCLLLLLILL